MQSKQNIPMLGKDTNILKYFKLYKDEKYNLNKQEIEKNYRDLISKILQTESCIISCLLDVLFKMSIL